MSPVYWKPRYATRGQRHRAWVKQQARREAALRREAPKRSWLRFLFRRGGNT
jgi:hypothetical protein